MCTIVLKSCSEKGVAHETCTQKILHLLNLGAQLLYGVLSGAEGNTNHIFDMNYFEVVCFNWIV